MLWQPTRSPLCALLALILAASLATVVGCGSDTGGGQTGNDCPAGQTRNPLTGQCHAQAGHSLDASDGTSDSGGAQAGADSGAQTGPDAGAADTGTNSGADASGSCPDRDHDGAADSACGGTDCDDNNPAVAPGMPEVCDTLDNDCDGHLNQGLDCWFYAQSSSKLYKVDPFAMTATEVGNVPGLFDMDTHPDGTLYGITPTDLEKFDASSGTWTSVGSLGIASNPNGLAINNEGTAFITAGNQVYTVDLSTGAATAVGSMGGTYNSSGDCVVNKDNSLYMSSDNSFNGDLLVLIDGHTGRAQTVGPIGYRAVYGLTAAWGKMYGLTDSGQLIDIDVATGQGTLVHTFSGISFYGAASTPQR